MANNSKKNTSKKVEKKNEVNKPAVKKTVVKKVAKKDLDKVKMGEGTTISANWGEDDKPNITVTNNTIQQQDNSKLIGIIISLAVVAIAAILIIIAISIKNGSLKKEINKLNENSVAESATEVDGEENNERTEIMKIVSKIGHEENKEETELEITEGKVITLNSSQRDDFKITIIEIKENSVVIATSNSMSEGSGPIDLRAYNTKFEVEKGKETVLKTQTMNYGDSYTISIKE